MGLECRTHGIDREMYTKFVRGNLNSRDKLTEGIGGRMKLIRTIKK
jgi:hypothetical protein